MSRPWSRRRPWPYRGEVGGVGVMFRPGQDGEMVARKATRLDAVAPTTYDYGSLKPYEERPYVFGPLTGGMGQSVQQPGTPTRYRYALDADLSVAGRRRRGPEVLVAEGIGGPTAIQGFVDYEIDSVFRVPIALAGDSLKIRTGPASWAVRAGLPGLSLAGETILAARAFRPQVGSVIDHLYLTTNYGNLFYYHSGSDVITAIGPFSFPEGFLPTYLEVVGEELWAASRTHVSKAGNDPTDETQWAAPIRVGGDMGYITGLGVVGTTLIVYRTDGPFTLNDDGTYNELSADLRRHAFEDNTIVGPGAVRDAPLASGRNPGNWRGANWVGYGDQSWRLTDGSPIGLDLVGLSRLVGNDGPVRGRQVAFAGDDWFGWFAYYDVASDCSFLVKWGTWVPAGAESFTFEEVPNGAVRVFRGRRITALGVTNTNLVGVGNPLLLIGFADGGVGEVVLPRGTPDPLLDPNCRFMAATSPSEVYWPDHDAEAPADLKHWRGFAATGPVLTPTDDVTVGYRATPDDPWTALAPPLAANQSRVETPGRPDQLVTATLQVKETLGGGGLTSPDVAAVVLFEQVRPALQLEWTATAIAAEGTPRLDGVADRRTGEQIRDALRLTAGPGPTVVRLPDTADLEADFVDYAERLTPAERSYGLAWDVDLAFVQFRQNTVYGGMDRLGPYWVDDLEPYWVDQLEAV